MLTAGARCVADMAAMRVFNDNLVKIAALTGPTAA
jgi:hypothetical protein